MQPGRNDPCPCGSGKKFKKCCFLNQEPPANFLWRKLGAIHDSFAGSLVRHALNEFGADSVHEAWAEFWLWDEEQEPFQLDSVENQLFFPFYLYNWFREDDNQPASISPESRTVARDYLDSRGRGLSELERRFLAACIETPFSFHEVMDVSPGLGFDLKDVFLGNEINVSERLGSQNARVGDVFFGKVVQIDQVAMLCGMGRVAIPPTSKRFILELKKGLIEAQSNNKNKLEARVLHEYDIEIRELFLDLQKSLLAPPQFCNTDGDTLALHRISYEIPSAQIAFDALKSLSLFFSEAEMLETAERDKMGVIQKIQIDWHKRGNKAHKSWDNTILGHLEIVGQKLTIEVNSEKRAKKIKAEIKKRMGELAKHISSVVQSPEAMMKQSRKFKSPAEPVEGERENTAAMESPEIKERMREMALEYWENWYRQKIPALGNRTPIQAAKSAEGRELLESLLIEYERHDPKPTNEALKPDVAAMRKRLGLSTKEN